MKILKVFLFLSIIGALTILLLIAKNHCFDKGLLALKEEKYELAIKYLKPIAELGDRNAQSLIGECYAFGFGVPKNVEKALYWFRRSANKSNCSGDECIAEELYFVGEKYLSGLRGKIEKNEAMYWIQRSAENGYPKAIDFMKANTN